MKIRGNYLGVIFCNCLYLPVLVKFYGHCGAAPLEPWANVRSTAWCPRQRNVNGCKRQTTVSCDEQLLHLVSVLIQQGNEKDALTC
uniref:Putative secreted protein n=1 Tax=Ixodes ricinus TaxID=34613 RepID=A0A6B0U9B6_IXORI